MTMDCPKVEMPAEIKQTFEKLFSHLDLSSIGGKNYTSKRTNMAWKGFQAGWNVREVPPDRPAQPAGEVGVDAVIKKMQSARSGLVAVLNCADLKDNVRRMLANSNTEFADATTDLRALHTPLTAPVPADVVEDKERMDWLVTQCVEVRTPLRYGSRENFHASPDLEEDESDLRAKIDKALQALKRGV